jgi:membrane-bound lytic murein transglycosylase A
MGRSPLRLVSDQGRYPDIAAAWDSRDGRLRDSLEASEFWFDAPSSQQWFPWEDITHAQAKASVARFRTLIESSTSFAAFRAAIGQEFDVYESVGWDGSGTVLFTGYYAPEFNASRTPTHQFTAPIYARPSSLVTDATTGLPIGRRMTDGQIESWPPRKDIEASAMLAGTELFWLENPLDTYIAQVNGSAKLRLTDDSIVYVGYAGKTDRPYTGLGRTLVDQGHVQPKDLSLPAIEALWNRDPATVQRAMHANESFVFFQEYDGGTWPAGSLGVPVTTERSLATDKKIYPRGGVVLVETDAITYSSRKRPFTQFMLDQDTGGAIRAPGRADIFMGIGKAAEILAGGQYAEGRLYYLFLKPGAMNYQSTGVHE